MSFKFTACLIMGDIGIGLMAQSFLQGMGAALLFGALLIMLDRK